MACHQRPNDSPLSARAPPGSAARFLTTRLAVVFARRRGIVFWLTVVLLSGSSSPTALAVSNTWYSGAFNGSWQFLSNWGSGPLNVFVPGVTSGTTNTDTATFQFGSSVTAITPDASRNLKDITFDTSAAAYTIGTTSGNPLLMTSFGTIQIASTFSASNLTETVNAPLTLEGDYTLADNSAHAGVSLDFGGAISAADQGGSVLTVAGTGNTAISGAIGGIKTIDLVKSGAGTLTLSGNNTFTGGVTINAGLIILGSGGALNSTSPNAVTFGSGSSGDLALVSQSVTISALSSSGGTPVVENGSNEDLALLTVNNAVANTYGGVLENGGAESLALAKSGAGTLTLSGNNTFTGGVTINAGNLKIGNPGALNSQNPNVVAFGPGSTGTLTLNGNSIGIGNLNTSNPVGSPVIQNASATPATLTVAGAGVYAGVFQDGPGGGSLALVKAGAGTLTLNGNNTFSGGVTLSAGTVVIGNNNALGTGALTAARGTLQADGNGPYTLNNAVALSNTLIVAGGNSFTLAGPIIGSAGIMKTGAGTLTLSGTNSFSGATTINAGTLQLTNSTVLGTSTVVLNGGTLRASSALVATASLAGFGGTSTSVTGAGTGWTVNNTAIASNPINNNVLTLTDGAFYEARAAYSNTLQPIALGANGFHASYTYTPSSPNLATAADGVVFVLQGDARGLNAIGGTGGGFAYTSENGTAVQPSVAIALNIWSGHVIGTNLLTNGNPNNDTYLPVTPVNLISGFPIDVSLAYDPIAQTITETLNEENTNHTFTHVYSTGNLAAAIGSDNVFVGFGGGTGQAVSTQTISNFSYTVTGPAVSVNNVVLNGGINSTIDVAATAAGPTVTIGTLSVGSGTGTTLNITATTAPMNQAYGLIIGATTLAGSVTFNVANNGAGTGTLTLSAVSDGGSNSSITKIGAGTLTFSGTNSLSGATNVMGGTLNTVGSGTIGTGALTISTANGVASAVNLGNSQTVSSLSGMLAGSVPTLSIAGSATLTDNQSSGNTLFAGLLINSGEFIKSGSSSLELNGAPTLNANSVLQVNGGTLRFNIFVGGTATIGTGVTANVLNGATLELAGSVSALSSGPNRVNITNNSTAPGLLVSGKSQHVGNIDGSGNTQVDVGSDLTANHIIQSALVIGGTPGSPGLATIDASDASGNPLAASSGFALAGSLTPSGPFGAGGISSGSLLNDSASNGSGSSPTFLGSPNSAVGIAAVPEPSTILLSALALLSLLGLGIRRPINDAQVA